MYDMRRILLSAVITCMTCGMVPARARAADREWRDAQGMWREGGRIPARIGDGASASGKTEATFRPPLNVAELNTENRDDGPWISPDGLTLVFSSNRAGTAGGNDLWRAIRAHRGPPFEPPVLLPGGVNGPGMEIQPTLTADGLEILFVRSPGNRWEQNDIYRATRPHPGDPFGPAAPAEDLNTDTADAYPSMSPDGLTLTFTSRRRGSRGDDIWMATRSDRTVPFDPPQLLEAVNSHDDELAFAMRGDGRVGYLVRRTVDGGAHAELFVTSRDSRDASFAPPQRIAALSSPGFESGPSVTADGLELFFFSTRVGSAGESDIWRSLAIGVDHPVFIRGDVNDGGGLDVADPVFTLTYLFAQGPAPSCLKTADLDDDGDVEISDPVCALRFLFAWGPAPASPFPVCGWDRGPDDLLCPSYPPCK